MMFPGTHKGRPLRSGITLTEILIGIMILGIGLVSLATLFPIGLLRLREAQRQSRSAFLFEAAASDLGARGMLNSDSFLSADRLNLYHGFPLTQLWYYSAIKGDLYDPLIQDTGAYGADPFLPISNNNPGPGAVAGASGLPFAYDPLWRYQVVAPGNSNTNPGIYLRDLNDAGDVVPEARFGSGVGFLRRDPDGGIASAHGLQRLTNFNGRKYTVGANTFTVMPNSVAVPNIFVSPEDLVWNEANNPDNLSTVLPDMTIDPAGRVNDWRYSWMFTGRQANASNPGIFEGDIVIYENRPFSLDPVQSPYGGLVYQPADETVVEAVYGYSSNVVAAGGGPVGYGAAADRTVLLRWPSSMADPLVKTGDWICDVTYERRQNVIYNPTTGGGRFYNGVPPIGVFNPLNGGKWDNMPAQRAFWYQVVKVSPAIDAVAFTGDRAGGYRSLMVQVSSSLRAKTPLTVSDGQPAVVNAALIAPHVVNVIPQTIVVH